jgi:hypothetical protein
LRSFAESESEHLAIVSRVSNVSLANDEVLPHDPENFEVGLFCRNGKACSLALGQLTRVSKIRQVES